MYVSREVAAQTCQSRVTDFTADAGHVSDHRPVLATLQFQGQSGERGDVWRLDISILTDQQALREVQEAVAASLPQPNIEIEDWDGLKRQWREACIKAGRRKREREAALISDCLRRIRIVRAGGSKSPVMQDYLNYQSERYSRLILASSRTAEKRAALSQQTVEPELLRLTRNTDMMEKPSLHIEKVVTEDGSESNRPQDIDRMFFNYFSNIFSSENDLRDQALFMEEVGDFCSKSPCLQGETAVLTNDVTSNEVELVLKAMSNGAAPGTDGLPTEFYRSCWPQLKGALCDLFNAILSLKFLPKSLSEGRLKLLAKAGQDKREPSAWRPISLLNADYKAFTSLLVRRLQQALPEIVSQHQFCSVTGRSIFAPLNLTRDLIQYTNARGANGFIVNLDQEKAFDRLEHNYIKQVMERYGLPEAFIAVVQLLYRNMSSSILINGRSTPVLAITRGVRQGCPLSPALFVLAIDPFLKSIQHCSQIRGLPSPGCSEVKVFAYADDVSLFLRDADSLIAVYKLYSQYAHPWNTSRLEDVLKQLETA